MERIYVFLGLFTIVYFLEAIGGSYINSAVQNIERQFQMSSKTSGLMIAASDFGYIPSVVFIAYFGSKGNRAKWIGAGALLMSAMYLMLASPNFLFRAGAHEPNTTAIMRQLTPKAEQISENATLKDLLAYPLVKDRIPSAVYRQLLLLEEDESLIQTHGLRKPTDNATYYTVDGWLIDEALFASEDLLKSNGDQAKLRGLLSDYIQRRVNNSENDLIRIRRSASAPFAFCGSLVNQIRTTIRSSKCEQTSSNNNPFWVFFFAMLFLGVGRTVPWSLGMPLLDDNIKKKSLPAYFGAISSIKVLGPICGYLIGSACNKLYYTLQTPRGLTPADPTWIGAWWIGFIIIGVFAILPAIMLYFFPAGNSGEKGSGVNLYDVSKKAQDLERRPDRTYTERIKDFTKSCKEVMTTKIYFGSVIGRICDILAFKGYIVFLPKYLENHFGIPQYLVHRYMALFGVFGFGLGTACGGFITRRFKLNGRRAALFVLIVSHVNLILYVAKIFLSCESTVNSIGIHNQETNYNFTKTCNADCGCDGVRLYPVCDHTGHAYFSPCHAGCREAKSFPENPILTFSSCECAPGNVVSKDFCQNTCKTNTVLFFLTVLPSAFMAGLGVVPGMLIVLRCVPPETRSLSLGLQGMLVSLFGTLPSPILWGVVIDAACLVWDHTCSGARGACSIYHPERLRVWMHVTYCCIRLVSLFTDIFVWYHAKNLNILDEPEQENREEINDDKNKTTSIKLKNIRQ